jgi:hypothetical protein
MSKLIEDQFIVTAKPDGSYEIRHQEAVFLTNDVNDIGWIIKEVLGG